MQLSRPQASHGAFRETVDVLSFRRYSSFVVALSKCQDIAADDEPGWFQQVFADELIELVTTRVSGSTSGDRALSVASETWDEEKVRKLGWSLGGSVRKNFLNIMVPVLFC